MIPMTIGLDKATAWKGNLPGDGKLVPEADWDVGLRRIGHAASIWSTELGPVRSATWDSDERAKKQSNEEFHDSVHLAGVGRRRCSWACGVGGRSVAITAVPVESTDAKLKLPLDRPILGLLILATFYKDVVGPSPKLRGDDILIDSLAAMVFIPTEEQVAIDPDFPRIFGSQAEFDVLVPS